MISLQTVVVSQQLVKARTYKVCKESAECGILYMLHAKAS